MTKKKRQQKKKPKKSEREKLLELGQLAKAKLYRDLLKKISDGTGLKPTEIRALHSLEKELEAQGEETASPPPLIDSMSEAAEYLGVSKRTVSHHLKRGNFTQNPDGTFDRAELDRWASSYGRKKKSKSAGGDLNEKDRADLRWRLAKARREELLVAQLKGQLVPKAWVEQQFAARAHELTSRLLTLPRRIAHKVAAKSKKTQKAVVAVMEPEIYAMLENYSRPLPGLEQKGKE